MPSILKTYNERLAVCKDAEIQKMKILDDPTLRSTIVILKNFLENFLLTKSLIEKVSILEEISFWLRFEFTNSQEEYDFAKANVILKMAVAETGKVFEILIHFKLSSDFYNESRNTFISEEFFTDFDLTLNSMMSF